VLQPSAFLWPDIWVNPASITHTVIRYPARGIATLWAADAEQASPEALAALIGAPRARLLTMLASPATTGDLAARLGVTPSAVSQHLRVLRAAGLVTSETAGRSRIHALAPLGRALAP
jgi:DNA-binding transcriptional ArsR family regulator